MSRRGFVLVIFGVMAVFAGAFAFSDSAIRVDSTVDLKVGNLTCGACVERIEGALSSLEGIGGVEVDLNTGRTRVAYDRSRTDAAAIADRITAAGYSAGLVTPGASAAGEIRCPAAKPVTKSGCGGTCCG